MGEIRYPALGGEIYAEVDDPQNYSESESDLDFYDHNTEEETRDPPKDRPPLPAIEAPSTFQYDIREKTATAPSRTLYIGGNEIPSDRDITVRTPNSGVETVDIRLWNLDAQTWRGIDNSDGIEIEMGWQNAFSTTVSRSTVVTKRRRGSGADRSYIIRGVGRHGHDLRRKSYSQSFNNIPPHQIVEFAARDLGLGVGYISRSSERIDGYYALTKRRTVKDWFNRLASIAASQTGNEWIWYIEQGDLYFHPPGEQTAESVTLGVGKSVIRATPVGNAAMTDHHPYEIAMRCEPSLRRGMTVRIEGVDTIPEAQRYRVASVMHESSTTRGDHRTTAVVTPTVARDVIYGDAV